MRRLSTVASAEVGLSQSHRELRLASHAKADKTGRTVNTVSSFGSRVNENTGLNIDEAAKSRIQHVPLPPKDWPRVDDVFEGARALPADRRPAYLAERCGGDEALRQEVESLLAWDDARAESFLDSPVLVRVDDAIVMKNLEGQRIGPYQLASKIGAGGMGEVYKARDTRLDRTVAIKVLTAHLADDPHARERFQREARAVAALNHPHICTLHDVGSQDPSTGSGQAMDFLVMEYLDGETLAERLAKGPLPLDRALQYAIQIADALDKAHRQGITHRDLKPGNVMLTTVGTKLLDFGLAKLRPAVGGVVGMSAAPNVSPSLTGRGTILGTLQYMAPEQLEGKPADARTDIFAFGALLYEMLTGKRAFEGTSQASLISAILSSDPPPIALLQPLSPPALDRVVKKCLAKDPDERWQSAHDLTSELKWIAESGLQTAVAAPGVDAQVRSRARTQRYGWIAAAVFLLTTLALAGALYLRRAPVDTRVYRSTFVPPANVDVSLPPYDLLALSPDGRRLAFVAPDANGRVVLWVRELAALAAQPLADTEGAAGPFWSPDSRFIAFSAGGKLKKIDASGGPAISLCDTNTSSPGSWGRGDVILFTPANYRPALACGGGRGNAYAGDHPRYQRRRAVARVPLLLARRPALSLCGRWRPHVRRLRGIARFAGPHTAARLVCQRTVRVGVSGLPARRHADGPAVRRDPPGAVGRGHGGGGTGRFQSGGAADGHACSICGLGHGRPRL